MTGRTMSALNVPFVPGVHDFGNPMIGITLGSVIVAKLHERPAAPNGKRSWDVGDALFSCHRPVAASSNS